MKLLHALIVDDEPWARDRVRSLLANENQVEVVGEACDGLEAVDAIFELEPDLVFLDVQMPELDGLGVIERVGLERMPAVVFVTAYDEYALRAFEVHAVDYLLKPFERKRFQKALKRAVRHCRQERSGAWEERLRCLLNDVQTKPNWLERVLIKMPDRMLLICTEEIDWIEAAGNYVCLHVGQESHLLRQTMKELERQLDPAKFLRIHRSTIVNLDRIGELQPLFSGEYQVCLKDGTRLTLSKGYRQGLLRFLSSSL